MSSAKVWVTFAVWGTHSWFGAPQTHPHLKNVHAHEFHFKVSTVVEHNDREIEFHDLMFRSKAEVLLLFNERGDNPDMVNFGTRSCEAIAARLGEKLVQIYHRNFEIEVSEDGKCGAIVTAEVPS